MINFRILILLVAASQAFNFKSLIKKGAEIGSQATDSSATELLQNVVSNIIEGPTTTTLAPVTLNAHDMDELMRGAKAAEQRADDLVS